MVSGVVAIKSSIHHTPANHTILLVDDDRNLRRFMHILLVHHGYNVIEARDGVEAINKYAEAIEAEGIDLVLMDVTMPRKDGITAYYEIIELDPNAIVLFMSAYSENGLDHIPNGNFMQKPMMSADVLQKISELIG